MGYDNKYGHVTTEHGDIGEDEPVIVFRAQDGTLPTLLREYRRICEEQGSPQFHLDLIDTSRGRVEEWQADPDHFVRRPPTSDGPAGRAYRDRHGDA